MLLLAFGTTVAVRMASLAQLSRGAIERLLASGANANYAALFLVHLLCQMRLLDLRFEGLSLLALGPVPTVAKAPMLLLAVPAAVAVGAATLA